MCIRDSTSMFKFTVLTTLMPMPDTSMEQVHYAFLFHRSSTGYRRGLIHFHPSLFIPGFQLVVYLKLSEGYKGISVNRCIINNRNLSVTVRMHVFILKFKHSFASIPGMGYPLASILLHECYPSNTFVRIIFLSVSTNMS